MHACLIEPIVFGCYHIIRLHTMPHSLVLSYDKNNENTCWVFHHRNDRCCICTNLICFSECLSCSFILKDPQGGTIMRQLGHAKAYMMRDTNIFTILVKVYSFSLCHPKIRILDGSLFHCCFLLVVYMIHLANGGATLEIGSMDLHSEERLHLLDAPSEFHSCHGIEHWYTTTSIFVDCAHTCHAR